MKVALLLLLGLLNASTCVQAESTMNTPIPIDGNWNNGSEQITQSKTRLTVYVDHKRRGPFRGRFYKFQDGEQLIFVDFTDDTGCCTGRINTSGKTIVWSNNTTWTKDTVAATFPLHPITIVPPRLNPVNPPTPVVPPRPVEVIPPPPLPIAPPRPMNGSKVTYHDDTIAINGYRMDWCLQWGKYCGQNAADVWCKRVNKTKSSVRATNFKRANDIGLTYVLQTRMVCNAPTCDGFEYITCELTGD